MYQIVILSTWGDRYYVGLNGIQMYDIQGRMILLKPNSMQMFFFEIVKFNLSVFQNLLKCILDISAYPSDVNILVGIDNDVRTPDKLVNGINDTSDGSNMWLAPILPSEVRIYS